jgi:hypothetical protein
MLKTYADPVGADKHRRSSAPRRHYINVEGSESISTWLPFPIGRGVAGGLFFFAFLPYSSTISYREGRTI